MYTGVYVLSLLFLESYSCVRISESTGEVEMVGREASFRLVPAKQGLQAGKAGAIRDRFPFAFLPSHMVDVLDLQV